VRGVDFLKRKIRVEQLADDFFPFNDKQPEFFAVLLFAERAKSLNLCLAKHA